MKKSVLLHIGSPKTGTTSIQEALQLAEGSGALRPVRYPIVMNRSAHHDLANSYIAPQHLSRAWRNRYEKNPELFVKDRDRYKRTVFARLSGARYSILSAENFGEIHEAADLRSFRADLESQGFDRFFIVLYVRDPADFYLSQSQQTLKASSRIPEPAGFRYPFLKIAETSESVFPGHVMVRMYSPGFDVLADFAAVMQQCFEVSIALRLDRKNVSLSAEGMHVLELYRSSYWAQSDDIFTPDTDYLVALLMKLQESMAHTKPRLKDPIAQLVRANHRDDAESLFRRYGVDLACRSCVPPDKAILPPSDLRVADILESFDPLIASKMLLSVAKLEIDRRTRPVSRLGRIARRIWRLAVPPGLMSG